MPVKVAELVFVDDDNDGVLNEVDKCPATLAGKVVDSDGCLKVVRLHVRFANDSYDIKDKYMPKISEVVSFMNENKSYDANVDGHTDTRGSEEYNQALSFKRAAAVANEIEKQGIGKSRIKVGGFGETGPIATNDTEEGMAKNRRADTSFNK